MGESACWLDLVCDGCGTIPDAPGPCPTCGPEVGRTDVTGPATEHLPSGVDEATDGAGDEHPGSAEVDATTG